MNGSHRRSCLARRRGNCLHLLMSWMQIGSTTTKSDHIYCVVDSRSYAGIDSMSFHSLNRSTAPPRAPTRLQTRISTPPMLKSNHLPPGMLGKSPHGLLSAPEPNFLDLLFQYPCPTPDQLGRRSSIWKLLFLRAGVCPCKQRRINYSFVT